MKIINYQSDGKIKESKFINNLKMIINLKLFFFFFYLIINLFISFYIKNKDTKYYNIRIKYLKKHHITYNELNLQTFQDKLNWLLIHDTNKLKGKCADKILLHKYSKKILGKDICNKILKIYNNVEEININELPDKFVLKTNHGSSFNIIVNDKKGFNITKTKKKIKKWLNIDYGKKHSEFHYSFIKRKIYAEEFIGEQLKNYKFLSYNGKPKFVYVSIKEGKKKYRNFYNMNWEFLNYHCLSKPHPKKKYDKPKLFDLMKLYASKLSKNFKFVRVDLYELNNEIRLGELTFIPMNSFFFCKKKEDEIELGKNIIFFLNNFI